MPTAAYLFLEGGRGFLLHDCLCGQWAVSGQRGGPVAVATGAGGHVARGGVFLLSNSNRCDCGCVFAQVVGHHRVCDYRHRLLY